MTGDQLRSLARRWTALAAALGVLSIAAGAFVSFDFGSPALDRDEIRVPGGLVAVLAWLGGLVVAIAAARRARKDGERAVWALLVATVLLALALLVIAMIWAVANAGLS